MMVARAIEIATEEGIALAAGAVSGRLKREIAKHVPRATFELGVRYKYYKNAVQYSRESVANPFDPIWIDPNDVEYMIDKPRRMSYPTGPGYVQGGDWDMPDERVEEHGIYIGLVERFIEHKEWSETEYVARAKHGLKKNGEYWNYTNLEKFLQDRTAYVEELYKDIQDNGYRTANERNPNDIDENRHKNTYYAKVLEPVVAIGRSGDILFMDGFHRFAIARLLDLNLPVHIFVRHAEWQVLREDVARRENPELPAGLKDHPDLQDVR